MTDQLPHVLLTRFNAPLGHERPGLDPGWLEHRLAIFESITVPSVARQHLTAFTWLVFADADTAEPYRGRLEKLAAAASGHVRWLETPLGQANLTGAVEDVLGRVPPALISSRLDSDDALAPAFLAAIRRKAEDTPLADHLTYFNPPFGYQLSGGRLAMRVTLSGAFISAHARTSQTGALTVLSHPHHRAARWGPIKQVGRRPLWLQIIHDRNISNRSAGLPVARARACALFPHLSQMVHHPSDWIGAPARLLTYGLGPEVARMSRDALARRLTGSPSLSGEARNDK